MRNSELEVNDKNLWPRIIGFAVALVVAVGAIAFGVTRIGYKEAGYHSLTAAADQEVPLYSAGIHADLLFEGSSDQIKLALGQAETAYSEALKRAYKLLDAEKEYPGVVNLATLNTHPGERVELSEELFNILTDAAAKTQAGEGYSLFAGPLYAEWNSILILSEPEDFDPLRDQEERDRLEALRRETGDPDNARLVVTDEEKHSVRLEVSQDYLAFLAEMEREPAVLDLGLLREAYLLELTARELEARGYTDGVLRTDSGLLLTLSGKTDGIAFLYGYRENAPVPAARMILQPGTAYCLLHAFPLAEGESLYYQIEDDGTAHFRNPWLPSDGRDRELLLSTCVIREDQALTEACYESIRLRTADDPAGLRQMLNSSEGPAAYILREDSQARVYCNASAETQLAAAEDYGYRLER